MYLRLQQYPIQSARDAVNLKIDKYRPGAPFSMAGDSNQHVLFAMFGEIH
ncbi:hypothetical protein ECG581_0459 [Escherichia coli G58-1]|nr:hypothetical protein ECG581_0459 [Escherichia coli G58-1]